MALKNQIISSDNVLSTVYSTTEKNKSQTEKRAQ